MGTHNVQLRQFNKARIPRPELTVDMAALPHPIDIEIGCGVGWHPIVYARSNPERSLVAIEHTRQKYGRFISRLSHHSEISNLFPVQADAIDWISHFVAPLSVSNYFILYPNPHPKSANQRWIRMPFMECLLETLRDDGRIVFATNIAEYAEEIRIYATHWKLNISLDRKFDLQTMPFEKPRTHFEKKYLARGETCFEIHLGKNYGSSSEPCDS